MPTTNPPTPTTTVEGGFTVQRISPAAGYINQQTMVSIDGIFPSFVNVWFGDQPGQLVHHSSNWIIVVAPARSQAGPVDMTLRSNSAGTVLLAQDAFTYVDPNPISPPTTSPPTTSQPTPTTSPGGGGGLAPTTTAPGGGSTSTTNVGASTTAPTTGPTTSPTTGPTTPTTTPGGTSPTTSPGGGDGDVPSPTTAPITSTTQGAGPTTTAPGASTSSTAADPQPTTTTEPPGPERRSRPQAGGDRIVLSGGLQGVPLQGLGGLGDVSPCVSEPCRSRRV